MRILSQVPVISTAIYTAGDVVGTKLNLGQFDGVLRSIHVSDDGNQGAAGFFLLFDGDPGAVAADNAAFAWPTGSLAKLIGIIASPTFQTVATKKVGSVLNIGLTVKTNALYVVFVTTGTPTQVAVNDLKWKFGIEPNGNALY